MASSRFVLSFAVLLALAGCAPKTPVERGEAHYQRLCAACHGPEGGGMGRLGTPLAGEILAGASDEEILAVLRKGRMPQDPASKTGMMMPPRGGDPKLSDEDLADVLAFLRTW